LASPFEFGGALLSIVIGGCNGKKKKNSSGCKPISWLPWKTEKSITINIQPPYKYTMQQYVLDKHINNKSSTKI
jgi:hypothetical protein